MQSLSFQVTPPAKPVSNTATQESANTPQDTNTSFKDMLTSEVRSKQARADQEKAAQARMDERVKSQEKKLDTTTATQPVTSGEKVAETKPVDDTDPKQKSEHDAVIDQVILADSSVLKQSVPVTAEKEVTPIQAAVPGIEQVAVPVGLPTTAALEASQIENVSATRSLNVTDSVTSRKGLTADDALRADLAQGRKGTEGNERLLAGNAKADNTPELADWVDKVLPDAVKAQPVAADAQPGKLLSAVRDTLGKDAGLTATGIQAMATANTQQTNALQPAQAASANVIAAYPGKPGWNEAIGQRVVYMVGAAEQSATLTLNPPDLGPLQVVIHVHNDQADATFISDNSEVRKALEDGMGNLRDMLNQSGINLGQTNVGSGSQQQELEQMARARSQTRVESAGTSVETSQQKVVIQRASNGLVDTFA